MSGCSQRNQIVQGPLSTEVVRACLIQLGWRVDLACERAIVAMQIKTKEQQQFTASVNWEARHNHVLVNVKVLETTDKQAASACAQKALALSVAIKSTCGSIELQPGPAEF